jgi:hypothetical protein
VSNGKRNGMYTPNRNIIGEAHRHMLALSAGAWVPTQDELEATVETVFWASLLTEEGRATLPRVVRIENPDALAAAGLSEGMRFREGVPFEPRRLAKLSVSLPPQWAFVVAGREMIGAFSAPTLPEVVALAPGAVSVRFRWLNLGTFDREHALVPLHRDYVEEEVRKHFPGDRLAEQKTRAVLHLARAMSVAGHGGTLLIVPEAVGSWRDLVDLPSFAPARPFGVVQETCESYVEAEAVDIEWRGRVLGDSSTSEEREFFLNGGIARRWEAFQRSLDLITPFTFLDGAVVLTRKLQIAAVGAKITASAPADLKSVMGHRAEAHGQRESWTLEQLGGTRHQSAGRFVRACPDAFAIVVSQDRHITALWFDGTWVQVTRDLERAI